MVNTYSLGLIQNTNKLLSKEADTHYSEIISKRMGINCSTKKSMYNHKIPLLLHITDKFCDNFTLSFKECNTELLPSASFTVDVQCGVSHDIDLSKVISQIIPSIKNYDVVISSSPSHGTASVSKHVIAYKSNTGYAGKDTIKFYLGSGGKQISTIATINLESCCEEIADTITICEL